MLSEKQILLESYARLAEFLSKTMGPGCTTAVYELGAEPEGHVFAAYGQYNNRKPGDPLTMFLIQIIRNLRENNDDGVAHVDTEASTAKGRVKLRIFAIRDSRHHIVGLFVLQTEIDLVYQVRDAINQYLGYETAYTEESVTKYKATNTMSEESAVHFSDYMQQRIREEIESFGVPVERMTNDERIQIIRRLEKMEVFFMKDSVKTTAELLGISVPTVYRLMKR
jgi:predicted transcriptional regulator YheO